ncbi:hypothetical protein LEN26_014128 [Aphanomyces euteiches]|nr:hypothetical protein LEN26_014128 [Aphanomyces euteiches]
MESSQRFWYVLVDIAGIGYKGTTASKVKIPRGSDIAAFKQAVHAINSIILQGIVATQLEVYENKAAFDRKDLPLQEGKRFKNYGSEPMTALLVVVPQLQVPQIPPDQQIMHGVVVHSLPFSDGVNPLGKYFDRQDILERMHNWNTGKNGRNRFLLLSSPPASGKTSLLTLFQHKYQSDKMVIKYISMKTNVDDPWMYLAGFGLDYYKRFCKYKNVIYMLDDAQTLYDNCDFWFDLIKDLPLHFGGRVRFIISATHMISSGEQSSPPDFRLLETIGRDTLLLSTDQSLASLNLNAPLGFPSYLQNYLELKQTIVEECNGLIGALCKCVLFYDDQSRHHVPTQIECLQLFYSKKLLEYMDGCFGIVDKSCLLPEECDVLLKYVMGEEINANNNYRLLGILESFAKAGILISDWGYGKEIFHKSLLPEPCPWRRAKSSLAYDTSQCECICSN